MISVAEIFMSYQGEGPLAGTRTLFIRLQGCNFVCEWCDTAYAKKGKGTAYSAQDLFDKIKEFRVNEFDSFDICITGGEPMLQQRDPELLEFLQWASIHHRITLETNGSIEPDPHFLRCFHLIVISPKLNCAGGRPISVETLMKFQDVVFAEETGARVIFKYVIDTQNPEYYINEVIKIHEQVVVEGVDVYLMPLVVSDSWLGMEKTLISGMQILQAYLEDKNLPYSISTRLQNLIGFK